MLRYFFDRCTNELNRRKDSFTFCLFIAFKTLPSTSKSQRNSARQIQVFNINRKKAKEKSKYEKQKGTDDKKEDAICG